jgi:hypothetical protein
MIGALIQAGGWGGGGGMHLHPPWIFERSLEIKKEHNIKNINPKNEDFFLLILPL